MHGVPHSRRPRPPGLTVLPPGPAPSVLNAAGRSSFELVSRALSRQDRNAAPASPEGSARVRRLCVAGARSQGPHGSGARAQGETHGRRPCRPGRLWRLRRRRPRRRRSSGPQQVVPSPGPAGRSSWQPAALLVSCAPCQATCNDLHCQVLLYLWGHPSFQRMPI